MAEAKNVERWTMHRAIFYNFWYYPNQELIFKDGCAVLRGHNASGKSVTTQSLITVLLDGDVRSHKLDPFGGRERKITDTVLGEKDLMDINYRIGYLALEFKKGKTGVTKTIGMGIEAIRDNKRPKIWYFVINGKRIGDKERDLRLYTKEVVDGEIKSVPLDEKGLKVEIEQKLQCGKVYSEREEYASAVNKQLFGFENLVSYKGLIDLLLQARSPRLSDMNKPEAAAYVLNDSLPSLTEEEIRPLTSSIEAIDRLEKDLIDYKRDLKAIKILNDVYQEYNEVVFAEKSDAYLKSFKQFEATKRKITELKKSVTKDKIEFVQVQSDIRKADNDLEVYKAEKADLGVEEIESIQTRKETEEGRLKSVVERLKSLQSKKDKAKELYNHYKEKQDDFENEKSKKERELTSLIQELKNLGDEMDFEKHTFFHEHFTHNKKMENYSFDAWDLVIREYRDNINGTRTELEKRESILRQVHGLENAIGEVRMKSDSSQELIDQKEQDYEEELYQLKNEMALWIYQSKFVLVPEEVKQFLLMKMEDVYDSMDKDEYLKPLKDHVADRKYDLQSQKMQLEIDIKEKTNEATKIMNKINEWKNKEEVEPEFAETKRIDWDLLIDKGVDFKPFYEAFEFKKGLDDEVKIHLQNALFESGILSALVLEESQVAAASKITTVLKYQNEKPLNLSEVLQPAENDRFIDILKGISFQKNDNGYILSDGMFETNFVKGKSSLFNKNIFLGKASREQYRANKIAELEEQYLIAELEKDNLEEKKQGIISLVESIDTEYNGLPKVDTLKKILEIIKREEQKIKEVFKPEIEQKTKTARDLNEESKKIMNIIKKRMQFNVLTLTVDAFNGELNRIDSYNQCVQDIKNSYKDMHNAEKHAINNMEQAELQKTNEEDCHSDMIDANQEKEKTKLQIERLTQRLKDLGQEDILKRVAELSNLINVKIPNKRDRLIRRENDLTNKMKQEENTISHIEQNDLPFEQVLFEAWGNTFNDQLKLGYVTVEEGLESSKEKAQFVIKKFGHLLDKNRNKLDNIKNKLLKRYQNQSVELPKYELEMDTKESEYYPQYETRDESKLLQLIFIKEQMARIIITLNIDENRIPPLNAVERLTKRIQELEFDANEKDRELYQDILINTLGDKIRRKIQYVESWQKEINKFMEHENIIKFRIKWVPKKTDKEGELDTTKLVEALKKDSRWIDIDEIGNHFRSKIREAKRRHADESEANLQKIMKEILDYRTWFEFEIYFTKKGGKEKRLTRNTYGELSGGQRVLAMVTPVLAALYAKYLEGREDAPKIFTLDEAFARVDDENINIMFEYIYKLQFNYILNSQSLWGCFESVPSLNIYELSRPDNRPFVSIQSYYWNGNTKRRIDEEWFEKEKEGLENVKTTS